VPNAKRKRVPCLLNPVVVRRRRDELGLTTAELAKRIGLREPRTLEHWLKPDERRRPDIETVERLAQALGLGVEDICAVLPPQERTMAEGGTSALLTERGLEMSARALLDHRSKFLTYARHIGFRLLPLRGYVRRFDHDGRIVNTYATVRIWPQRAVPQANFVFSFGLGPIRIDYGVVELRDSVLHVQPFFAAYGGTGRLAEDGSFRVRTWFGREPCPFVARCREVDFELELYKVIPDDREPVTTDTDVVTFVAAPHHLAAIELDGE
jgi:transcriptional regulator with XRE-family HTH domain